MFLKSDIEGCDFGLFSFSLLAVSSPELSNAPNWTSWSRQFRSVKVCMGGCGCVLLCVCVSVCVCVCVQLLLKGCRGSLTRCQPAGRSALLYSTQFDISKLCYISLRLTAVPPFGKWAYLLSSRKTDTTLMSCWTWSYCQQPVSLA